MSSKLHFPSKLYQIIEKESNDIIRWENNGKSFRILDYPRFEMEISPKYFKHANIASIQRQLNLYGFKCVIRGLAKGSFYHPSFLRGEFEKVVSIRRPKVVGKRRSSTKRTENQENALQLNENTDGKKSNDVK